MLVNCRGQLLDTSQPKIMGILNITPDSFFDGKRFVESSDYQQQIDTMIREGADIIDIGGMSSRPGAELVDIDTEWNRIEGAIRYIRDNYSDQIISVDTIHAEVARKALELGVQMINDISAGHHDENMFNVIATYRAAYVMMHMRASPASMQDHTSYPKGMAIEIMAYFKERLNEAKKHGVEEIILDLGFGFSKTLEQNYKLMNLIHTFKIFSKPILTGISRKSMIYKLLDIEPAEALTGTSALHMKALLEGSGILRVHDVQAAKEVVKVYQALQEVRRG